MTETGAAAERRLTLCRICGKLAEPAGFVHGSFLQRYYAMARCQNCGYAFVVDPTTDFAQLYDDRYYAGRGADPLVDYSFELEEPERTIRIYEWRGVALVVAHLLGSLDGLRWADYGCGNGGLVRYLGSHHGIDAIGFEDGAIVERARAAGIPVSGTAELDQYAGAADVVTAIEVLEHTLDPVAELRRMRALMRPGGLLFLTTGNLRPHVGELTRWRYVVPEIHVSFFEPRTIAMAMDSAGLQPERRGLGVGFNSILTYKVLKNLRIRQRSWLTDRLPQTLVGAIADQLEHLSEHPVGWAR